METEIVANLEPQVDLDLDCLGMKRFYGLESTASVSESAVFVPVLEPPVTPIVVLEAQVDTGRTGMKGLIVLETTIAKDALEPENDLLANAELEPTTSLVSVPIDVGISWNQHLEPSVCPPVTASPIQPTKAKKSKKSKPTKLKETVDSSVSSRTRSKKPDSVRRKSPRLLAQTKKL